MSVAINCAGCGRGYKLRETMVGQSFRCKGCGKVVDVPGRPPGSEDGFLEGLDERDSSAGTPGDPPGESVSEPRRRPRTRKKTQARKGQRQAATWNPLTVANGLRCVLFGILLHLASFVSALVPHGLVFSLLLNMAATMVALAGQTLCLNAPRESRTLLLFGGVIGIQVCALGLRVASLVVPLSPTDIVLQLLWIGLVYLSIIASAAAFFLFVFALKRLAAYAGSAVGEMHADWILHWGAAALFLPQILGRLLPVPTLEGPLAWIVPTVQLGLGVMILMRFIDLVGCLKDELAM